MEDVRELDPSTQARKHAIKLHDSKANLFILMQTRPGNVNNIVCGLHSVPMCATNASPTFEWRRNMLNSCIRAFHQTKEVCYFYTSATLENT